MLQWLKKSKNQRRAIVLAIIIGLLVMVPAAYAALYTISTTDNSVNDWNSVPVFQSDPIDYGTASLDILNTKVASEDTNSDSVGDFVNFMVQTNSTSPLGFAKGVVASIDCDNDGVHEEFDDRLVVYNPGNDTVTILHGNQFGQAAAIGPEFGQKVGAYYEWGVPISDLFPFPDDSDGLPDDHCQGTVGLKFATANLGGFPATSLDTTQPGPYALIDLPTAVSISNFSVAGVAGNALLLLAVVGLAICGTVVSLKHSRRSRS